MSLKNIESSKFEIGDYLFAEYNPDTHFGTVLAKYGDKSGWCYILDNDRIIDKWSMSKDYNREYWINDMKRYSITAYEGLENIPMDRSVYSLDENSVDMEKTINYNKLIKTEIGQLVWN